jgi:hypothetical protein
MRQLKVAGMKESLTNQGDSNVAPAGFEPATHGLGIIESLENANVAPWSGMVKGACATRAA